MPTIYIIAGPPGIGKSTSGARFIPKETEILDPDFFVQRYRKEGFTDYKDIGHLRFKRIFEDKLISGKNFGIELNLGFPGHYDLLKKIKSFRHDNKIEVVLFHTDDINICLDRAKARHQQGLHLVPPETVSTMYYNTIPLLKQNLHLISKLKAIDVTENTIRPQSKLEYDRLRMLLKTKGEIPRWLDKELMQQLSQSLPKEQPKEAPPKPKPTKPSLPPKKRGRRM